MKEGLLVLNLGTPQAPHPKAVKAYLGEFLADPRVIDLPLLLRRALLHGVILRVRPKRSAHAYQSIWRDEGSPLALLTSALVEGLREKLQREFSAVVVAQGMRYGMPSWEWGLRSLMEQGVSRIHILPLYPQYASSTTGSMAEAVYRWAAQQNYAVALSWLPPFYEEQFFVESLATLVHQAGVSATTVDHVLMSYHGLPASHILDADRAWNGLVTSSGPLKSHCLQAHDCCERAEGRTLSSCYRAQCFRTSRALARQLQWSSSFYSTSFQSRLGRQEWIRPYTEEELVRLARSGVKRLAVLCPSFVTDCLETLEEIGLRGKETFLKAGGKSFQLIPCLNADPHWIEGLSAWVKRKSGF